jgi:predicted transglutaminase-like cysteine proteinase
MSALRIPGMFAVAVLCATTFTAHNAAPALAGPTMSIDAPIPPTPLAGPIPVEPFGRLTAPIFESPLTAKWLEVERSIEADLEIVANCRRDRGNCKSPQARQFLDIVEEAREHSGLARLGIVNRAINLAIRPQSDWALHGVEDRWSSPLATLAAGAGDCEDYAIAKFVALREAGVAASDLRLVIVRDAQTIEDHAVVTARLDGRWRVLDNRNMALAEDIAIYRYRPMFVIGTEGVSRLEGPVLARVTPAGNSSKLPSDNIAPAALDYAIDATMASAL